MEWWQIIIFIWATWFLTQRFYSPRAQIERLLKEMYNIPIKLVRRKRQMQDNSNRFEDMCRDALNRRYKMLEALLNYYFDPEENKEYIQKKLSLGRAYLNMDGLFHPEHPNF